MHTPRSRSRHEAALVLRHAWTVLLGQLAVMAFGIVDTMVAGRYSSTSLAALSVGAAVYISVYVALIGVIQALLPRFAQTYGAQDWPALGEQVRQAAYLCLPLMAVGMTLMLQPTWLMDLTGVPLAMREPVQAYLGILAWALPPALAFRLFSTLNQALGKPRWVTLIQVLALAVKLPLSIWLTFGGAGLPAMGVVGCAWATWIVQMLMCTMALAMLLGLPMYRPMRLLGRWSPPNAPMLGEMLRLGLPAGLSYMVEVTSFTLMALYISRLGAVSTAAHQIAANVTAVLYMIPLSLSIATSARVGFWIGAGSASQARQVQWLGFRLLLPTALTLAVGLFLGRDALVHLYSQDPAVTALAASLLAWVALYHVADATQCLAGFLLRCHRVSVAPFVLYGLLLWGIGLGGGYWLCYEGMPPWPAQQSPSAFWAAATLALYAVALALLLLLQGIRPVKTHKTAQSTG